MSNLKDRLGQSNNYGISDKVPIRKSKDSAFYGVTFDQAGRHPISLAIDFFRKDGSRFGIFNMEINSPILFDLGGEIKPQSILLKTNSIEITIEGRNLQKVYEYILEQRLVWVKEPDSSHTEIKEGEVEIEKIEIEENQ